MCRNKDERMERCDCDTSEARRLRRHTRDALDRYADAAYQPIVPNFLPSVLLEEPFTTASVRDEIHSIHSSVEELIAQGNRGDTISAFVDKKINNIGAGVEYLSENLYGSPTDQDLRDAHDSFRLPFLEHKETALAKGMTEEEAEQEASIMIDAEYVQTITQLIENRNSAFKKALTAVGVKFANPETLKYSFLSSDDRAVAILKKSLSFYPQSWIDASNSLHKKSSNGLRKSPLQVKWIGELERPTYQLEAKTLGVFNRRSVIAVNDGDDFAGGISVGLHEFGHRIEHSVPGITNLESFFLRRRTGHYYEDGDTKNAEHLSAIQEESPEDNDDELEFGYKDNFPTHYMGRFYGNGYHEILSMGMETLFTGTNGGFAGIQKYKEDSDYKKFILGVLASSAAK
jgi:hypothetical protein